MRSTLFSMLHELTAVWNNMATTVAMTVSMLAHHVFYLACWQTFVRHSLHLRINNAVVLLIHLDELSVLAKFFSYHISRWRCLLVFACFLDRWLVQIVKVRPLHDLFRWVANLLTEKVCVYSVMMLAMRLLWNILWNLEIIWLALSSSSHLLTCLVCIDRSC